MRDIDMVVIDGTVEIGDRDVTIVENKGVGAATPVRKSWTSLPP